MALRLEIGHSGTLRQELKCPLRLFTLELDDLVAIGLDVHLHNLVRRIFDGHIEGSFGQKAAGLEFLVQHSFRKGLGTVLLAFLGEEKEDTVVRLKSTELLLDLLHHWRGLILAFFFALEVGSHCKGLVGESAGVPVIIVRVVHRGTVGELAPPSNDEPYRHLGLLNLIVRGSQTIVLNKVDLLGLYCSWLVLVFWFRHI